MWNIRCIVGMAIVGLAIATAPALAQGIAVGSDGWTVVTPSPDSRMIYVSSSSGDDNNNGLSENAPKRTLAAGFNMLRNGHPDWLLLKSGDTWHEAFPNWTRSGRSPTERMVVRSYGGGERARLMTGTSTGVLLNGGAGQGIRDLVFMDLHLNAHTNPGTSDASGFRFFNGVHNVLVENCYTENYRVNYLVQAFAQGIRASNVEIRRSIIVDALATNAAHAQGIYADGVDGLVMEENVFDMNGWSPSTPTANIFRHNIYIQTTTGGDRGCTDVVTRGNITARASATGFMMRTGGISEDNLFLQNPVGLQFGQTSGPASSGIVRNNVFLDSRDISSNTLRGMGMNVSFSDGVEVSGNILAHQRSGTDNIQAIGVDGTFRDLTIRNNIVYDWNSSGGWRSRALGFFGTPVRDVQIIDNQLQQPFGGYMVSGSASFGPAFTYSGNRYFSANGGTHQFSTGMTYADWLTQSGEGNSSWGAAAYAAPQRDIESYMASLGRPASVEAFLDEARKQSRGNWRPEFTSEVVNQWVREGFSATVAKCPADLNGDGRLDIMDMIAFVELFSAGDMAADVTGNGTLDIFDFIEFQRLMEVGCD